MKRLLLLFLLLLSYVGYANAAEPAIVVAPAINTVNKYLLYPTTNIYTFLKQDTRNSKIWRVQYSTGDDEFEVILNSRELVSVGNHGQFALYSTTNNWTFLLLDTINGDVWHVQCPKKQITEV